MNKTEFALTSLQFQEEEELWALFHSFSFCLSSLSLSLSKSSSTFFLFFKFYLFMDSNNMIFKKIMWLKYTCSNCRKQAFDIEETQPTLQ